MPSRPKRTERCVKTTITFQTKLANQIYGVHLIFRHYTEHQKFVSLLQSKLALM